MHSLRFVSSSTSIQHLLLRKCLILLAKQTGKTYYADNNLSMKSVPAVMFGRPLNGLADRSGKVVKK